MTTNLKVFGEFFRENELEYRTKTILQIGDSWDLIGTIIMKNPGSAFPTKNIQETDFATIKNKFYPEISVDNWFEFKADSTMSRISEIFDGTYIDKKVELNGVIIIYNLFNVREAKIQNAVQKANSTNSAYLLPNSTEVISLSAKRPIYLGFRWEYKNTQNLRQSQIEKFATELFDYIKKSDYMYLENDMVDNHFYHPLSPQIKNIKYRHILENFFAKLQDK